MQTVWRQLVHRDFIVADLEARDRDMVLKELLSVLPKKINLQKKILNLVLSREKIGTTALGNGLALPHCFSPLVETPLGVFGVSKNGIDYSSLDATPVHFIFLLILPETSESKQLKINILQNIRWLFNDRFFREQLRQADNREEIQNILFKNMSEETLSVTPFSV